MYEISVIIEQLGMAIYTPRGMPISFPMSYAFTLLARLYPRYSPHRVLKIAEGLDKAPKAVAYLLAFTLFALRLQPVIIFAVVLVLPSILSWMQIKSRYIDLVVRLGILFNTFGQFGIISIGLAAFGWNSVGWKGLCAFLGARFVGGLVNTIFETQEKKRVQALTGIYRKDLEFDRCFIDAYRFCAEKMGVTLDISVSEQEIESGQWYAIEVDYSEKKPVLFEVRKFS
jgi:hypothetical protein